jgi:flagellar protein FlaI
VVNDRVVGEIDLFDLMKAALRQRPEYILVGEIRGKEAYVLFQAMATGHTTYSTVHADSVKALVHRLEGKPINIPRAMLQSLDIVLIQASVKVNDQQERRVRQVVELLNVDVETQEVLSNTAFNWSSSDDSFSYTGKSYILEQIRTQLDLSAQHMLEEMDRRKQILEWMHRFDIRAFTDVAKIIAKYNENPEDLFNEIQSSPKKAATSSLLDESDERESNENDAEADFDDSTESIEKSVIDSVKNVFSFKKKKEKNPSKGG